MNGAKHRDILQRHLRWTVLADRNAAMRSAQVDVAPADVGHAHLVIGTGQETRKGIKERHLAARGESYARAHDILLGDVALIEMVREGILKYFRESRVLNVARNSHD